MIRLTLLATALTMTLLPAPVATAAAPPGDLDGVIITIEPTDVSVVLGEHLELVVTVTNESSAPTPSLIAHLDITDPAKATSVDPEDWTSTLSKPIGVLEPGAAATVDWNIQPIAAGTFAVYAVALSSDSSSVSASNVLAVSVADQRSLNPGGILPLAVGAPAVLGALLLFQIRTNRRSGDLDRADPTS